MLLCPANAQVGHQDTFEWIGPYAVRTLTTWIMLPFTHPHLVITFLSTLLPPVLWLLFPLHTYPSMTYWPPSQILSSGRHLNAMAMDGGYGTHCLLAHYAWLVMEVIYETNTWALAPVPSFFGVLRLATQLPARGPSYSIPRTTTVANS